MRMSGFISGLLVHGFVKTASLRRVILVKHMSLKESENIELKEGWHDRHTSTLTTFADGAWGMTAMEIRRSGLVSESGEQYAISLLSRKGLIAKEPDSRQSKWIINRGLQGTHVD